MLGETRNLDHLERSLRVPRLARAVLGFLVLVGSLFFILISVVLIWAHQHSGKAFTFEYALLTVTIFALAVGFAAVGIRLMRMRTNDERLFGSKGLRVAAYCAAALGVFTIGTGLWSNSLYLVASGVFGLYMAFAMHRSAVRLNSKGTKPHEP
jgi:hypothetical protein